MIILEKAVHRKIYMISVTHTAEAKRRLLLREILLSLIRRTWPEKNIEERLEAFWGSLEKL